MRKGFSTILTIVMAILVIGGSCVVFQIFNKDVTMGGSFAAPMFKKIDSFVTPVRLWGIKVDTIDEITTDAGLTAEGVLLKDGEIDGLNLIELSTGFTIEGGSSTSTLLTLDTDLIASTVLTGNEIITLSGEVTGVGATAITTTIAPQISDTWAGKVNDETGSGLWVFNSDPTFNICITTPEVKYGGDIDINAYNAIADSTVYILNSDGTYAADLDVEGDLYIKDIYNVNSLVLEGGTYDTTFIAGTPLASVTYTWPTDDGSANDIITTAGDGTLSWTGSPTFGGLTLTGDITATTAGGLNINLGTSSGDDFTIDTSSFVVEGDTGKVGIGTPTPNSLLHIKGNTPGTVGSHPAGQLIIQNPTDSVFSNVVITAYESDGDGNPDQQLWYLGSSSGSNSDITFLNRRSSNLHLGTSGTTQMTIDSAGKVGIGITTNLGDKFTVYDTTASVNVRVQSTGPDADAGVVLRTATAPYWTIYEDESDSQKFKIKDSVGGDRLTIDTSGNVGIGVTDPDTTLEILNAGDQLKLSFDGTDNTIFAVDTSGNLTITPSGTGITVAGTLGVGAITTSGNITIAGNYLGRDSDNLIDFSTDNQIDLKVNSFVRQTIDSTGGVFMYNLKSGTTQVGAGATTNELWVDTDDDNTIKLGT